MLFMFATKYENQKFRPTSISSQKKIHIIEIIRIQWDWSEKCFGISNNGVFDMQSTAVHVIVNGSTAEKGAVWWRWTTPTRSNST